MMSLKRVADGKKPGQIGTLARSRLIAGAHRPQRGHQPEVPVAGEGAEFFPSRNCRGGLGILPHPSLRWFKHNLFLPGAITVFIMLFHQPASGQDLIIEHAQAREIARRNGWLIREETPTGVIELEAIVNGTPWYNMTFNADAADSISTDECFSGGLGGWGLSGSGVTLGVWDAAGVRLTHQEFGSRASQSDGQSVTHWHSTHVAGTMVAAGIVAAAKGMAPSASLDCYDWTYDMMEMSAAAAAGLRVSNHSYGFVQGWYYDSLNDDYYWYGDRNVSEVEDYRFGLYGGYSYFLDVIAADYPYYLICRSAGNDRDDTGPPGVQPHLHWKIPYNVEWEDSTDSHAVDGDYDSITMRNTAKNILTIGAVDDVIGGYAGTSSVSMSSFSGWGPCDDGRIKPDIVANGINLFSTDDGTDTAYRTSSGTSMAAPSAAGSLGLLIEHWRTTHPAESDMLSSTLKGLVLHTADEVGSAAGPDYESGWGLMNSLAAANMISTDVTAELTISEWVLCDGDWIELAITTDSTSSELRASICWTDPPGPSQSNVVDPPTKILVNDLDLRVERTSPLTTFQPWVLDGANPSVAATTGDNVTDNIEQVVVYTPGTDNFILRVTHKGVLTNASQIVSLIISGAATIQVSSTATISGNVATSAATPTVLSGVEMSGTNSVASDVTDAAGDYSLSSLRVGGCETITPRKDGWVFEPASRSYGPVTGSVSGEGYAGTLVYDVDPPNQAGDEYIGVGDLSFFSLSWLQNVPPGDAAYDFDCDSFVGVGDLSYFTTAWLKSAFDGTIVFPPCHQYGGARAAPGLGDDVQLKLRLVAVATPSQEDLTQKLPEPVRSINVGNSYFVELWVRNRNSSGPGVTSAYVDVALDTTLSAVRAIWPSEVFGAFTSGYFGEPGVRDLGGSTPMEGVGLENWWARVATVEVDAVAPGRVQYVVQESETGIAVYRQGKTRWEDVETVGVTLQHVVSGPSIRAHEESMNK